ncbi:MAG: hypothetical protein J6C19_14425 [Lachnospiraceae bacterium]|nr:hypothetical protein [Lachnospiraceae bacterium]MBO5146698.1 hypothetical protein [Lachnospiraceae bacterium]
MNSRIRQAVIWAISEEFGFPIYIDTIEQDLEEPCFLITSLMNTESHIIMNRYQRQYPYMIQYFPESEDYNTECSKVSDKLLDILEYVKNGDTVYRADSLSGQTQDGILNFSVTYKPMVIKERKSETSEEAMNELEQNLEVKG